MAMTQTLYTISGLAVELGKDRRTVSNALRDVTEDGRTPGGHKGWYLVTALRALSGGGDGERLDLNDERARLTREQADKVEMENEVRRGQLLARADVDAAVVSAFARVRVRLLSVPARVAPVCAPEVEAVVIEGLVRDAIYEALNELAETSVGDLCADDDGMVADAEAPPETDGKRVG